MELDDEVLKEFGGSFSNNLSNVLKNHEDSEDEIQTFDHSPYLDMEHLRIKFAEKNDNFTILSLNIQSIQAKFDKLTILISYLQEASFSFSAICLQESWLTDSHDVSLLQLPGYNMIHQGKRSCGHGGLIIYLREHFSYNARSLCDTATTWEGLFIDVFHESIDNKVTLGNIYRPPRSNNCNTVLETFIKEIRPVVETLSRESSTLILTGDFNIDLLQINNRVKYQDYFDQNNTTDPFC